MKQNTIIGHVQELNCNMNSDSEMWRKLIIKWKWHLHTQRQRIYTHLAHTYEIQCYIIEFAARFSVVPFENITIASKLLLPLAR